MLSHISLMGSENYITLTASRGRHNDDTVTTSERSYSGSVVLVLVYPNSYDVNTSYISKKYEPINLE